MKYKSLIIAAGAFAAASASASLLDDEWSEFEKARSKEEARTAVSVLEKIEAKASQLKMWPDLASAIMMKARIEYSYTEENALDAEKKSGLVAKYAERVEASPPEVRPMLRLALAHDYLSMRDSMRWWKDDRTRLADATNEPPWSAENIIGTLYALFESVGNDADMLKPQKVSDWSRLLSTPDSYATACMPTLWDFAVNDAVVFVGREEDADSLIRKKVLEWLDGLVEMHSSPAEIDARCYALYRKLQLENGDKLAFAEEWFDRSQVSAYVAYDAAEALSRSCSNNRFHTIFDDADGCLGEEKDEKQHNGYVKAKEIAEKFAKRWPKSPGARNCLSLIERIELPVFSLSCENQLLATGEVINVEYRNITNLCFKIVPVDFGILVKDDFRDEFNAYHGRGDTLAKYVSGKAVAEWSVSFDDRHDYLHHMEDVAMPEIPTGYYLVFAATNSRFGDDGLPCHVAAVSRTDLFLIEHSDDEGWTGFVYDALTGMPLKDVQIEFWKHKDRTHKLAKSVRSADDGSWSISEPERSERYGFVRATREGQGTICGSMYWSPSYEDATRHKTQIRLVTDRSIYRPGQVVKFKGYLLGVDSERQVFKAIANESVAVSFYDANSKLIEKRSFASNDFGTFSGEFTIPRDRLTGAFSLEAKATGATSYERIRVEEYKRPKFTTEFENVEGLRFGSETKLRGVAKTYTGLPVVGAKVHWEVTRRKNYPSWCWWRNIDFNEDVSVAEGDATTDERGEFVCAFTPAPDGSTEKPEEEPMYFFSCTANVTDASGEMHSASRSFTLGKVLWVAAVWSPSDGWRNAGNGVKYKVWLTTLDGKEVPNVKGTLKVYALVQPKEPKRNNLSQYPEWQADASRWPKGDVIKELQVATDAKGSAEGTIEIPAGAYVFAYEAKSPEGEVRAESFVHVIDTSAETHAVMEPSFRCFEKTTVKVGETARMYFGTGYDNAYCRVRVKRGDVVLADEIRNGPSWVYEFKVGERHCGELAFETLFVRNNRLYYENHTVYVPWDDYALRVNRECMNSKLLPDARETWRFRISGIDTNDVRQGVEALAMMYDKSLDAFAFHNPTLDFSSCFGVRSSWVDWNVPNEDVEFSRWTGVWKAPISVAYILWPKWSSNALGIFDVNSSGWRGGAGMKMMRAANRQNALLGAVAVAEETAYCNVLMDCEPSACNAPMADGYESPSNALGGRLAKEANGGSDSAMPEVVVRKNLQETAFFIPSIVSDDKGSLEFSFTVPQALTGWRFFLLAHDKTLASGSFTSDEIVTVKPLMIEPNPPRFAREGDDFVFPVKISNCEKSPQKGKVTLAFEDAETGLPMAVTPKSSTDGSIAFELAAGESKTIEIPVKIPDGCGYLKYTAKAAGAEFTDGEEGFLPILSRRILVRESLPMQIKKAGDRKFRFEKLSGSGKSDSLRHVGLAAQVVSDPTWYAFLALPYLMEYPHECNEQIFSRFYANALAAKIANSDPEYKAVFEQWEQAGAKALKSPIELNEDLKSIMLDATPWVRDAQDEAKARRHIAELFGSARLDSEQERAVMKLVENIGHDGLWPWFPGGRGSLWVTMHILTGTARLKSLGIDFVEVRPDFERVAKRARECLDEEMEKEIEWRLKSAIPFRISSGDLRWLYLQSFDGSWNKKYSKLLFEHLTREWTDFSIAGQSLGAIALHRHGEKELAKEIVKSLKERAVRSDEYGLYWKRNQFFDCSLFSAPVSDQAVAMEAFLEIDPEDIEAYDDARLWMLEQKRTQNWSTTVSTVDAIYAILLGRGKGAPVKVGAVAMKLGDAEVPRDNVEVGTGFYEYRYDADAIKPEMGEITLSRKEDSLGWASLNWTYLEDVAKVDAYEEKCLRVTKAYYKKTRVDGKIRLVALGDAEKLLPGDELVSRISIDSDRVLEYVHLKDERPATAEPVDVLSFYHWQDGLGYYQSTKDTATHYYIDRLPKGNFVLETSFRVRQKGVFTSGLATAECMYAPEFGAHSAATAITVEK